MTIAGRKKVSRLVSGLVYRTVRSGSGEVAGASPLGLAGLRNRAPSLGYAGST